MDGPWSKYAGPGTANIHWQTCGVILNNNPDSLAIGNVPSKIYHIRQSTPRHGPLARYVILRVAHAPGMPGTFSPPPWVSDPDMHHGTCVMHVSWCMPGSLTSGFLWSRWRENVPGIPSACATSNFTYLERGPWASPNFPRPLYKSCMEIRHC